MDLRPEIQERITSYLDAIETSASQTKGFVLEQSPLLAQEYLTWEFWRSSIQSGILCVSIIVMWSICFFLHKKFRRVFEQDGELYFAFLIPLAITLIMSVSMCVQSLHAIQCKIAPRVVLLEKVMELVR